MRPNRVWQVTLCLILALALASSFAHAQTIIGTPGNGWQSWNLAVDPGNNYHYVDLNSNGAPFWDVPLQTFGDSASGLYIPPNNPTQGPPDFPTGGNYANKSIGWCLTSTGDCQGLGSALFAPGPLPFWGGPYNAATDTGGAFDPKVYFRAGSGVTYQATLYLNFATNTNEFNEFGWFETNATGTLNGTRHVLFQGSGNPPGTNTPDPVGKVVNFAPTQYFGYYYLDVSDPQSFNPYQGCLAFTIFAFNDPDCTSGNGNGQGDHNFAIFLQQVPNRAPIYWIGGQDPSTCGQDGDCNLTVVKVRRLPLTD
ncbi:hypothetical protein DYQ86_09170 [Acidobacteria bacterium AB60]|nr:hypothetical protein DYQ86_09170 [Acidobacteria bacterium AB60]